MDINSIIWALTSLWIKDYILIWFFLVSTILFTFLRVNFAYKLYLGLFFWFLFFLSFNLWINFFNDNDIWVLNWIRDFLINSKVNILFFLFYLIPFYWIFILFDKDIKFWWYKFIWLDYLYSFLLWLFYPLFLFWILISIYSNKLIFWIDLEFVQWLKWLDIINLSFTYFSDSLIFNFINNNSHIISFSFIVLFVYKIFFSWIINSTIWYLHKNMKLKNQTKNSDD